MTAMTSTAATATFNVVVVLLSATADTIRPGQPDNVLPYTTLSMTTFIGHGCRTSASASPTAASSASDRAGQCGRSQRHFTGADRSTAVDVDFGRAVTWTVRGLRRP